MREGSHMPNPTGSHPVTLFPDLGSISLVIGYRGLGAVVGTTPVRDLQYRVAHLTRI